MEGREGYKVQDTPPSPSLPYVQLTWWSGHHFNLDRNISHTHNTSCHTLCDGLMDWMTKEWFCVIVMFCWPLPSTGLPSLCHMMDGTGYPVAPQSRVRLSPLYTCKAPWGRISNWGKTGEEGTLDWGLKSQMNMANSKCAVRKELLNTRQNIN